MPSVATRTKTTPLAKSEILNAVTPERATVSSMASRQHRVVGAALLVLGASACSSSSTPASSGSSHSSGSGGSDGGSPPPSAAVAVSGSCNVALNVGSDNDSPGSTISTGEGVAVACSVKGDDVGTWTVNLSVTRGSHGLTLNGTLANTLGSQGMISAMFTTGSDAYASSECTVALDDRGNPPITTGRVWGTLTCPSLSAGDAATCSGSAAFVFENCATGH